MDLISFFTSSGLGSIIGLVGGLATKHLEIKATASEYDFKFRMRKADLEESAQERGHELLMADKLVERAVAEGGIVIDGKEIDAFAASQAHGVVDGALKFVRPIITGYLLIASSALFYVVWNKAGGLNSMSHIEVSELLVTMIDAALFLTVTCTSWWYGSRGGNISKK